MIEDFNSAPPKTMYIDLNSCFASVEQQANPRLRGRPLVVVAYPTGGGCVLASSVEAKKLGIKTGMRVGEAKVLCPALFVLEPDPPKYRFVHERLNILLSGYSSNLVSCSIDEFVVHFDEGYSPFLRQKTMFELGREIKRRIKSEIGDYLTVSIGIGPNRFLAKVASNLKKPDGLEAIDINNFEAVYKKLSLIDLHGINKRNALRLNAQGIHNPWDFYRAPLWKLKAAFVSIASRLWYMRLRGWEIDSQTFSRKSYGNSYALPKSAGTLEELLPILQKLVEKTGFRMREAGYQTQGVHVGLWFRDQSFWHKGINLERAFCDSRDIYRSMCALLYQCPKIKPVHTLSETCFNLKPYKNTQLELFEDIPKKIKIVSALDRVNDRWGMFTVGPAQIVKAPRAVQDRIAFGKLSLKNVYAVPYRKTVPLGKAGVDF